MSGRRVGLCAIALLLMPLVAGGITPTAASAPVGPERPNILLIVTDDQRIGMEVMPNTRALIRQKGVKFNHAYATTPICCPSRASIFTGQYTHNHNVTTNRSAPNLDQATTIQRYLSEAGYVTALFGKYLNHWEVETPPPHFDHFAMLRTGGDRPRYYDAEWNLNGDVSFSDGYSTNLLGKELVSFLESRESGRKDSAAMVRLSGAECAPQAFSTEQEVPRREGLTLAWQPRRIRNR